MPLAKVKCAICGKEFYRDLEPAVYKSARRYAHAECYPQGEPYQSIFTPEQIEEEQARLKLSDYIVKAHQLKGCGPVIYSEIKRLHDNFGFSYSGMLGTMVWYYEVKHYPVYNKDSIMFVSKFYAEAKRYWEGLKEAKGVNVNKQLSEYLLPTQYVEINSPRAKMRKPRLFNLDDEEVN